MTSILSAPVATSSRSTIALALPAIGLLLVLRTVLLFVARGLLGEERLLLLNAAIVAVDVISVLVVAVLVHRVGAGLRDLIGPIRIGRDLLLSLPITVVVVVAFVVATFVGNLIAYQGAPPISDASLSVPLWLGIVSITVMPVTIAVAEEVLYRGAALQGLRNRWGASTAVVVTSVFFGLQHLALTAADPQAMLARVITTALVGVVFAVLALRLRSLLPLIIAHWAIDVLGLGLPMLMAALR